MTAIAQRPHQLHPSLVSPGQNLTTLERVREVAQNPDPVVRNLQITQSYHELSTALYACFDGPDLNWCAYATWASKQAGVFIRNEEVPAELRQFLGLERRPSGLLRWFRPDHWLSSRPFLTFVRCTVHDVSRHVAEGNRLVYARLAPLFARFLEIARNAKAHPHKEPAPKALDRLLATMQQNPDTDESLTIAFKGYYAALFEPDIDRRAELIFEANARIGLHEQIRLQEAIQGALSAPVRRALNDPLRPLLGLSMPRFWRRLAARLIQRLLAGPIRRFEDRWLRLATAHLMSLGVPDGRLPLSVDIPPLADGSMFPKELRTLELPSLEVFLNDLDHTPNTTHGSAAQDWTDLGDRMNFIVDYFRSRQHQQALLKPPYSPLQVRAILRDRIPSGAL